MMGTAARTSISSSHHSICVWHCSACLQPNRDVRIRCSLIVSLLLRQEFRYKRIAFYQQQTFSDISTALPANVASRYFQLLCKSVEWATNTLNKQTISASTLQGCMKLLAICYYRLPKFGEIVRDIVHKQVRIFLQRLSIISVQYFQMLNHQQGVFTFYVDAFKFMTTLFIHRYGSWSV